MNKASRNHVRSRPASAWLIGVCFLFCFPVFVCGTRTLHAGSGDVVRLPGPGTKIKSGLSLEIDTRWPDGNGYLPVRVRLRTLAGTPAKRNRRVRVVLQADSYRYGGRSAATSGWLELPMGSSGVETTIAVPQSGVWRSMDVQTYEDGELLEDVSGNVSLGVASAYRSEAIPTILLIDRDAPSWRDRKIGGSRRKSTAGRPLTLPDIRVMAMHFRSYFDMLDDGNVSEISQPIDDQGILSWLQSLPWLEVLPPSQLPERWVEYTSIDLVFVSQSELKRMTREHRAPWDALRAWLSSGPTLCVYGVGAEFERLEELEQLLEIRPPVPGASNNGFRMGWSAPKEKDYSAEVRALKDTDWYEGYAVQSDADAEASDGSKDIEQKNRRPSDTIPFLWRPVNKGRVVAIASSNPFPGDAHDWGWLFNTLSDHDWMWYRRHGFSHHRENAEYWNLLIPGIGQAPVNSFLLLISLFVVLIGPINYFVLRRGRKLFLLLVTVPFGAGVVTVALFVYAIVSDGLGVRVRTRSITEIDQVHQRAVAWSRQSYYAGLAPSGGLCFPSDAAVFPVEFEPAEFYRRGKANRKRDWGDHQRLTAGYLSARSTAQFLVIEARRTSARLQIDESADGVGPPRVTNQLGATVETLLLCDSQGRYFCGGRLVEGGSLELRRIEQAKAQKAWATRLAEHRPRYPTGFDPGQMDSIANVFSASYYFYALNESLSAPTFSTSILERALSPLSKVRLEPRSYLAIVDASPEVSLGVESPRQEASFHVVQGSW
ncbi:MAG: hypothetical protein ACC628_00460 [Pirellulaceae bacterium]